MHPSIKEFLHSIETTPLAEWVSQSTFGFSALDMVHIAAVSIVFGMIAVIDLRLINVAWTHYPVTDLSRQVLPWTWAAFAVAFITGTLMFTGQAVKYAGNPAFLWKVGLLVLAAANMVAFHFVTFPSVAKWDHGTRPPAAAKLAGAVSLGCWFLVVVFGRWTAYYSYP